MGTNAVRARVYRIVARAVEEGVGYGWHRAYKHVEMPPREDFSRQAIDVIVNAVLNELSEVLDFEGVRNG